MASSQLPSNYEQLTDDHFISGSGIKLLDSLNKVESLFINEIFTIEQNENFTILMYDGSKQIESSCKTYLENRNIHLTLYRSKFTFENNILIDFEFGYIYP